MYDLRDAVVVVTGASSGLGRRFALDMARAGAHVVGLARRAELLERLAADMRVVSPESGTVVCDVSDTTHLVDVLGEIEGHRGRIDVLVNDAGIVEPDGMPPLDACRAVMGTNFFATVAATHAVLPGMLRRRRGVIVNVSSDTGRAPGPHEAAYGASKAAVSAFTESLSFDTEDTGVHLHVLYPGWVPTAMGSHALDDGAPLPPKFARRTEKQVSRLLLERIGGRRVDIDAAPLAKLAPVARALFPASYRRGVRKAGR
jgi:NAD(P)-dependent dehydrogenase (short-subunit alcohol dehydrogenase family)